MTMSVLILGLGNVLLSDEGVGIHTVNALADRHVLPDDVEVLDGGTSGLSLLDAVAGRAALIVCDAIEADAAPGTVIRIEDAHVPAFFRTRVSSHQQGLNELMAGLALIGERPEHITVFGIVPRDLDPGTTLSSEAKDGMEHAIDLIVDELARHHEGLACTS